LKALLVEDDPTIIDTISLVFELSWPEVKLIYSMKGIESIELVEKENPDVVILDLGLPDMDGIEVLGHIRKFSYVPVIILTARSLPDSIIKGLESGADDYVTKPFDPMVLLARVKSVIRRSHLPGTTYGGKTSIYGKLTIDFATHSVFLKGKQVRLTTTEWGLLHYMVMNEGKIIPYKELWEKIWGTEFIEDVSALRTCVWRLRSKLGDEGATPSIIESYRSIGYRFVKPA